MAICANCGRWAGIFSSRHDYCDPVERLQGYPPAPQFVAVRLGDIVWGVLIGVWGFAISFSALVFLAWMLWQTTHS